MSDTINTPQSVTDAAALAVSTIQGAQQEQPQQEQPQQEPPQQGGAPTDEELMASALKALGVDAGKPEPPKKDAGVEDPLSVEEAEEMEASVKDNAKQAHAFARLRSAEKEARTRFAEIKAKYDEAVSSGTVTGAEKAGFAKAVEERDAKIRELEEQIGKVNLEASPAFREKYDLRIAGVGAKLAKSLAQFSKVAEDKAPAVARTLLTATPDQLDAKLADMSPSVAGLVMSAWQEARELSTQRASALSEWRKVALAEEHENANRQTEQTVKQRREAAQKAIDSAAEAGCFVFKDLGTPESKEASGKFRDAFLGFVQTADPGALIRKAADGFAAPVLYNVLDRQKARIRELEGLIASRNGASTMPVSGGSIPLPREPAAPTKPSGSLSSARDASAQAAANAISRLFGQ